MRKNLVLILGANGMLGSGLVPFLKQSNSFEIITHSQSGNADRTGSLQDQGRVRDLLKDIKPDFIINLIALTNVDLCETNPKLAYALNVLPVKNIVRALLSERLHANFVQISTDHVYDRQQAKEDDISIVNNYALTKYLADEISQLSSSLVLRTNFFGQNISTKQSFSDWAIRNLKSKTPFKGFSDVFFSPLHLSSLFVEIERVLRSFHPGVFNLGSRKGMSKYDFIVRLADLQGLSRENLQPARYSDSPSTTPRPLDMRMDVSKYEEQFKTTLPELAEEIQKC